MENQRDRALGGLVLTLALAMRKFVQ